MIILLHCFWELSTSLNTKVVSSIASILQKNWSFYNKLDNIGNLLTICYVLVMCTFVREKEKDKEEERDRERRWKYRLVSASVGGHTSTGLTKASDQVISSSLDIYWSSWPNLNLHYIWKQRRRKKKLMPLKKTLFHLSSQKAWYFSLIVVLILIKSIHIMLKIQTEIYYLSPDFIFCVLQLGLPINLPPYLHVRC